MRHFIINFKETLIFSYINMLLCPLQLFVFVVLAGLCMPGWCYITTYIHAIDASNETYLNCFIIQQHVQPFRIHLSKYFLIKIQY